MTGPFCGCAGCHDSAEFVVEHPDHGERVVCEECADGMEVKTNV